jgi:ferric-dicitrate binding protein FerR (iron transport regulator)
MNQHSSEKSAQEIGARIGSTLDVFEQRISSDEQHRKYLSDAMTRRQRNRGTVSRLKMTVSLAAAALVAIGLAIFFTGDDTLSYRIGNGENGRTTGAWVHNRKLKPVTIRFENGSHFSVASKSAVQIVETGRDRVHIKLSQGKLSAEVNGNGHTRWQVSAGPYVVSVLGTIFDVKWDAVNSQLQVDVSRGRVLVTGEQLGDDGITVASGQKLTSGEGHLSLSEKPDNSPDRDTPTAPVPSLTVTRLHTSADCALDSVTAKTNPETPASAQSASSSAAPVAKKADGVSKDVPANAATLPQWQQWLGEKQ